MQTQRWRKYIHPQAIKQRLDLAFQDPQAVPKPTTHKMTIQFPNMSFDYFQPSPAKRFVSLTKNPRVTDEKINTVFHELKPLQPDDLIGEWDGYILTTGHPFEEELDTLNWFGNTFYSTEDVAPLIVARNGERVPFEDWGRASVSLFPLFGDTSLVVHSYTYLYAHVGLWILCGFWLGI